MRFFAHFFNLCAPIYDYTMKRMAILASGSGTNAERITQYFAGRKTAEVALIITNKEQAGVIQRTEQLNIPCLVVTANEFKEGKACQILLEQHIDFVVLAGFLLRVPDDILRHYPNRIINIHPSLLPKFGGKGMYGHHVHEAVLASGETESGITIHYVDEHYDEGGIILQAKCPVLPNDTSDTLASRVHQLEYEYFPKVIEELLMNL